MANVEKNSQAKETLIFLLTNLGFVINLKKSQLTPVKGVSDKFSKYDVTLTLRKRFGCPKQMYATCSVTKDHNYGINQTPRETLVHFSGGASRENSVQVLAATTNLGSERNKFLSNQNKIEPAVTERVEVVEGEFTFLEWQTTENKSSNDASKTGSGCSLSGNYHGGSLVLSGKNKTCQCIGPHCSETCNNPLGKITSRGRPEDFFKKRLHMVLYVAPRDSSVAGRPWEVLSPSI